MLASPVIVETAMDPWAVALDAMFAGPGSASASYLPVSGAAATTIRVIRTGPDRLARFGQAQVALGTTSFDIRKSDVTRPHPGDRITIGTETFVIPVGVDPISDVEGLTWTCWMDPVA